jgi:hypothetical protein
VRLPPNSRSTAQIFSAKDIDEITFNVRGIRPNKKKDETTDPNSPLIITTVLLNNDAMG